MDPPSLPAVHSPDDSLECRDPCRPPTARILGDKRGTFNSVQLGPHHLHHRPLPSMFGSRL